MAKGTWIALGVLGGIILVVIGVLGSAVGVYNEFVDERVAVEARAKTVDVEYQRAFALLPDLINLTETYMQNERDILVNISALRTGLVAAENGTFEAKEETLQQTVALMALIGSRLENYPELESDELFKATMAELINTNNKLTVEKNRYNARVEVYNAHRQKCCMPLMVANILGFEEAEFIGFNDRANQESFGNRSLSGGLAS